MTTDARLYLPPQVRLDDVAALAGLVSGLPFSNDPYLRVAGVKWHAGSTVGPYFPTMTLHFDATEGETLVDGERGHFCFYHGVGTGSDDSAAPLGYHKFNMRSTAYWIALATRLVDFFGGVLDYSDCDATDVDYRQIARPAAANDGSAFFAYNDRLAAQTPLTMEELRAADEHAAYKMDEDTYERAREHALFT